MQGNGPLFVVTNPDGSLTSGTPGKIAKAGQSYNSKDHDGETVEAGRTPAKAALGNSWPYRLWEVSGAPHKKANGKVHMHQAQFVRNLPVHKCWARGEAVASILESAESMTDDQRAALQDGARISHRAVVAAKWAAGKAGRRHATRAAMQAASSAASHNSHRPGDRVAKAAAKAALAAAVSDLVMEGVLDEGHLNELYTPWREVFDIPS